MLNTQVSFTIGSCDDAARAQRIMNSIFEEYNGPEADVLDTPQPAAPARKPRTPKPDPVAAYNAKAAEQGAPPIPAEPETVALVEPEPVAPAEPEATAETPKPAPASEDTRTTEQLLAALRDMARAKGGAWLRPILEEYSVDKLSSLTDDQMRKVLAS